MEDSSMDYDDNEYFYEEGTDEEPLDMLTDNEEENASADHDKYKSTFTIVTSQFLNDEANKIKETIDLPRVYIRIMLIHYRWQKQECLQGYFTEQEALFEKVPELKSFLDLNIDDLENTPRGQGMCDICYLDEDNELLGTFCGHLSCRDCWQGYLKMKIQDGRVYQGLQCMQAGCDILLDDDFVADIVKDQRLQQLYHIQLTRTIVSKSKYLKFCPGPECEYIAHIEEVSFNPAVCCCGCEFCLKCGDNAHVPANCELNQKWLEKLEDSISNRLIAAMTHKCPKCNALIEKNGGCNRVHCSMCQHNFCWFCLKDFIDYGHKCPRFEESATKEKVANAQKEFKRHEFFYKRYTGHRDSLKFESKLHKAFEEKKNDTFFNGATEYEVKCVEDAIAVLCQCRRTLMNCYSFSYFLQDNNESAIFLDNQENLHEVVEGLSESLEEELKRPDYVYDAIYENIQRKVLYCKERKKVLLEHVYEGTLINSWKYRDDI